MHSHTYNHTIMLSQTHSHTHTLTQTHSYTHTHTLTHSHKHTHTLTLTHSHSLTLTHSHKHTHTHTHTLTDVARELLMSFYDGQFYETLIQWTHCQHSEVQYNCAGVIGHLAINSECCLLCLFDLACFLPHLSLTCISISVVHALFVCLTLLASFFLPSHLSFKNMYQYISCTCTCISMYHYIISPPTEEYHNRLLGSSPSALGIVSRFMESDDPSFVHIALWITAQFSHGGEQMTTM